MSRPLPSPILLKGDAQTAYRDPAVVFHEGRFHLFFTYVDDSEGGPWLFLAETTSADLHAWSQVRLLTPRDKSLNYSSPGNIVRDGADWVICFQSYCRENGEKYGNANSRLFTMRSPDLKAWSAPELLRVKGENVPREEMGRMIDPYLLKVGGEWWCFFKQNGVSFSKSRNLKAWSFVGHADAGENACVIPFGSGYRLFSSPENGIRVMDSDDLITWHPAMADITLGQSDWDWAQGRLTAAFVMESPAGLGLPRYLMFFHASRYPERVAFDSYASIGLAFSDDLAHWEWGRA